MAHNSSSINLTTQRLDASRFAAFGEVVEGMDAVDKLYGRYGRAPVQDQRSKMGEPYSALKEYPRMVQDQSRQRFSGG